MTEDMDELLKQRTKERAKFGEFLSLRGVVSYEHSDYVDTGWWPLVGQLIDKLKESGWDGKVEQIKEKFGGLRFYVNQPTKEILGLIREYEQKSFTTCELCGKEGELLRKCCYVRTLCQKHIAEHLDKYKC